MPPTYTELDRMGESRSSRHGSRVTNFLLHTQEGNGTAESLAMYLNNPNNEVSYHYTVDNSGIVVDVVDTDYSSWSVLEANSFTINLCFAGSRASWNRGQWLTNMGRAIDIAAWFAVQDARKYAFSTQVITPPYRRAEGISDHRYVTDELGIGTHTDVGNGFPWDVFTAAVDKYAKGEEGFDMTRDELKAVIFECLEVYVGPIGSDIKTVRAQLTGGRDEGEFPGWPQLGGRTLVDAVALIGEKLGIEEFDAPGPSPS